MAVYAEWWWTCDLCAEAAEEPWGDEQAAVDDLARHVSEAHEPPDQDQEKGGAP